MNGLIAFSILRLRRRACWRLAGCRAQNCWGNDGETWEMRALDLAIDQLPLDCDDAVLGEMCSDVDATQAAAIRGALAKPISDFARP